MATTYHDYGSATYDFPTRVERLRLFIGELEQMSARPDLASSQDSANFGNIEQKILRLEAKLREWENDPRMNPNRSMSSRARFNRN